jgi:hypothetical protein
LNILFLLQFKQIFNARILIKHLLNGLVKVAFRIMEIVHCRTKLFDFGLKMNKKKLYSTYLQ